MTAADPGDGAADSTGSGTGASDLTHIDPGGRPHMVDVGGKATSERRATAAGRVVLSPAVADQLAVGELPKGEALTVARVAGVQAAKRTAELVPFCHPIRIVDIDVAISVDTASGDVDIRATVAAVDRTGVEMEALTAVTVAALTIYDMVKAVESEARITDVHLVAKIKA